MPEEGEARDRPETGEGPGPHRVVGLAHILRGYVGGAQRTAAPDWEISALDRSDASRTRPSLQRPTLAAYLLQIATLSGYRARKPDPPRHRTGDLNSRLWVRCFARSLHPLKGPSGQLLNPSCPPEGLFQSASNFCLFKNQAARHLGIFQDWFRGERNVDTDWPRAR